MEMVKYVKRRWENADSETSTGRAPKRKNAF